ncbi:lipocalin family protein [Micromonospora sp. WMMA1998]|uniref:Apolipoprotein D and lipocalin family protein n=1 Tax=Micromonospora sediminicola TaxID=946078 RepID=A0A1A9BJF4_9ACTN|nr:MULTISPECIES: lipocalin family protein [Micromonospora]WBC13689.1 lipocalin family protein [Micromonospora sp. WMMA1998]SBT69084.1 apolipoprotein D and lipocalin family protein [Micromonospora sediminicola]
MGARRTTTALVAALAAATVTALGATPAQAATTSVDTGPLRPVADVDVTRYAGDWYQVAAIPQWFEIQCFKNVKARYDVQADGTVGVRNTCRTIVGTTSTVTGRARSENPPADSALTVSFINLGGRWIYLGGPNYVVIGLDPDYRWAVVGDPDRSSGFVLSREPSLDAAQLADVKATLTDNGYDLCDFRTTRQDGGARAGAFC